MSKFIGRKVSVGIGRETARGTGVAASYWIPHSALSFYDRIEKARPFEAINTIALAPTTAIPALKWAEGDFEGEINCNSFGLLLYALLGADTPVNAAPAYTHQYTILESAQHPSLSIHKNTPDEAMHFELGMLNSLEITVELGAIVKFTANFISKASMTNAVETVSYSRDYKFVSRDLAFKIGNVIGDLAGASAISLKRLVLRFEKNLLKDHVLGSFDPEDIINRGISINGSIELNYEASTYKDYMKDGSVRALEITLTNSRVAIGALNPKLDIIFPRVEFSEWEPVYDIDDLVTQKINFSVLYDLPNTRLWSTFDLVNAVASY